MAIIKIVASSVLAALLALGGLLAFGASDAGSHPLGALSNPDLNSPYFSFGGVRSWAGHTEALTQATTTVCAIQSPAATSTLVRGSIRFAVSTTTASTVYLAKAATPYATTTSLGQVALGANAQGTVNASSSPNVTLIDGAQVFSPNTYFVVAMAGGVGTFSPTGVCQAEWQSI